MLGSVQEEIEVIFESKHSLWAQIRWLSIMRSLVLPPPNTAVTGLSFCRELLPGSDSARVKSACNAGLDSPQGSSSSLLACFTAWCCSVSSSSYKVKIQTSQIITGCKERSHLCIYYSVHLVAHPELQLMLFSRLRHLKRSFPTWILCCLLLC